MDTNLKDFLLTGWTDMGNGFALAIHPEHRTMYGGSHWVLIDTIKGRPDVHFGPESLFGDAPICGRVIAHVYSPHAYELHSSADVDYLPQPRIGRRPNPAVSDPDFPVFLEKIRGLLPQRKTQVQLGSPADRESTIERQLMAFEYPFEISCPRYSYRTSPETPLRSMTAAEKVHRFFLDVLHVDDRELDITSTCHEPVLEAILQHGGDRKEIFKEVLKVLDESGIAEGGCGVDTFLRYLVERRLTEELDAMEAPYGFVYVSPDGLDIGGYGKEHHEAHWDLKFDREYRAWRLMIATKRLILALDRHARMAFCTTPGPVHKVVNGIVDLAGLKPAAGRKRKLPRLEYSDERIVAWQEIHLENRSLRAVAKDFEVGAATLHRAIKPLDAYADLLVPGALPMPGSDEDLARGYLLMSVQRLAHGLRNVGLNTENLGAYPLLSDVVAGDGLEHDWTQVKLQVIQAWLEGVVPAQFALGFSNCDTEAELRAAVENGDSYLSDLGRVNTGR
ncbi:MAG: hypothetical protein H7Y60_12365 [Rhodospirillaceae bacterium]|nr:hypothetical protein [Rhodospirillales bacterium]